MSGSVGRKEGYKLERMRLFRFNSKRRQRAWDALSEKVGARPAEFLAGIKLMSKVSEKAEPGIAEFGPTIDGYQTNNTKQPDHDHDQSWN